MSLDLKDPSTKALEYLQLLDKYLLEEDPVKQDELLELLDVAWDQLAGQEQDILGKSFNVNELLKGFREFTRLCNEKANGHSKEDTRSF